MRTKRQPIPQPLEDAHKLLLQARELWGSYAGLLVLDEAIALLTKVLHK